MDFYEVLGVPRDADQKTIKRAYFKLVRQYTPEKEPERFQQIREAYENLTANEGQKAENSLKLEFPADPMGGWLRERLMKQMSAHDYGEALKTAEGGLMHYGEMEGFLYFAALCQAHLGKTGKAVKNFERLTKLFPDNDRHARALAMAYYSRGYGKKAYEAFGKCYNKGCRDYEFLDMYAMCCRDRGKTEQCMAVLKEASGILEKCPRDNIFELLDNYGGRVCMAVSRGDDSFTEAARDFEGFLERNRTYVREYEPDIWHIFMNLVYECGKPSRDSVIGKLIQTAEEILMPENRKEASEFRDKWNCVKSEREYWRMKSDKRLSEVMKESYNAFCSEHEDAAIARFVQRDLQLCILEEYPKINRELDIVKEEYPLFWENLKDFVYTLEHTSDLERLRQQYQKDYDRREKYISGGLYYDWYPHRRPAAEKVQWSGEEGTYTRTQPKIGRNDPCPCGSGKKYKNCCGKK